MFHPAVLVEQLQVQENPRLKTKIQQRKMIKLMAHAQKESKEHVNQLKPGDVLMGTLNLIIAQTMQVMIYNVVLNHQLLRLKTKKQTVRRKNTVTHAPVVSMVYALIQT